MDEASAMRRWSSHSAAIAWCRKTYSSFFVFPQNYVADCGVCLLLRPKRVEFLINVFEKLKEGKGEGRWHAVGMGMGSDIV